MKKRINTHFYILFIFFLSSCREERIFPLDQDGTPPKPISEVHVENHPGAAIISYKLPDDTDLLYIAAEYTTKNSQLRVFKSSFFNNHITVNGFGDSDEYEIRLYAVDRAENRSEPIVVRVNPLTPPIVDVFNSLEMYEDFGGIGINFTNGSETEVAITVLVLSEDGEWEPAETYYTKRRVGDFAIRGLQAEKKTFGIFVNDRWDNTSDTLKKDLTPLFEQELDKSKFAPLALPTDAPIYQTNGPWRLWDGSIEEPNFQRTASGSGMPHHITFNLGVQAKLSRFTSWQRIRLGATVLAYGNGNPEIWEMWGSNNPSPDGSYEGWTKLMDCRSIKPSGSGGPVTNEDIEYASRGEEFRFPLEAPPVQYIRIRFIRTWAVTNFAHFAELTFFGDIVN